VLLDTNALFLLARRGFPLAAEIERFRPGARLEVASGSLAELDRLVARRARGAALARAVAARLAVVPSTGRGDAALLELARRRGAWVVTADRALVERLRAAGVPALVPRDRTRLAAVLPAPSNGSKAPRRAVARPNR
jgi:rRNA-processing protein FCF1